MQECARNGQSSPPVEPLPPVACRPWRAGMLAMARQCAAARCRSARETPRIFVGSKGRITDRSKSARSRRAIITHPVCRKESQQHARRSPVMGMSPNRRWPSDCLGRASRRKSVVGASRGWQRSLGRVIPAANSRRVECVTLTQPRPIHRMSRQNGCDHLNPPNLFGPELLPKVLTEAVRRPVCLLEERKRILGTELIGGVNCQRASLLPPNARF